MSTGALPGAGAISIGSGVPLGAGVVDFLASAPEQRIWHCLRHAQDITAATAGTVQFFQVVTANAIDGNVERPGTIPEPQIFFVLGVGVKFAALATIADAQLLADALFLQITINNRVDWGPTNVANHPAGGGVVAGATAPTNGLASPQLMHWMPVPLVEKGGEVFRYELIVGLSLATLSATTRVEVAQFGLLFRRAVSQ